MKPRLAPGFRSSVGDGLLLLERRRLTFRQIGRDRGFVAAQIAEQRAAVREPDLPQASNGRHHRGGDDRHWTDHRHDPNAIAAEMRTAIERVTPAEARMRGPSPVVAIDAGSVGEEAGMIEACVEIAGNDTTGVEVRAAA